MVEDTNISDIVKMLCIAHTLSRGVPIIESANRYSQFVEYRYTTDITTNIIIAGDG